MSITNWFTNLFKASNKNLLVSYSFSTSNTFVIGSVIIESWNKPVSTLQDLKDLKDTIIASVRDLNGCDIAILSFQRLE